MKLKSHFCKVFCFGILLVTQPVMAGALITLGGGANQDQNSLSNQSKLTSYSYNAGIYAPLSRGDSVAYLGIEVLGTNINQYLDATTKVKLDSTDVMLSLKYTFGTKELFAFTAGFSPYTQAKYKATSLATDHWSGTSYMTKLGIQPDLGFAAAKFKIAASIMYYHAAYTKKTNSSAATSSSGSMQTFDRSFVMPTLELLYKF